MFALTALIETGANIVLAVFIVLQLVLFLKRRTSLPRLLPVSLWLQLIVLAGDMYLTNGQPDMGSAADMTRDTGRALIAAIVWTMYFTISARVRATFVNRRDAAATVPGRHLRQMA
jgi:hypothetical protein